ncbi:Cna B-type domain-containing protein, partial [uncultured Varibaculum sp.]|uniref:Cna B-type domain-containing protein n=1 Tax=uncultured Varibaculum sp. TaxID=413896 RepID=UPI002888F9CB
LAVIVALGSTSPAAAEGVTTWDDLVAKADTFTSGQQQLTISNDLTVTKQSKPLVVREGVQLTLEGKGTVTGINSTAVEVKPGGKLNLKGPSFTKAQFTVNGDLNFRDGSIHDSDPAGPVIFVNGGNFTMSGSADFSKNTAPEKKEINKVAPEGVNIDKFAPITVYNGMATINGGTIKENKGSHYGGAIALMGSEAKHASLNITGGEIASNKVEVNSYGFGGAIFAQRTNVNISGGNIHDNSTEYGGAMVMEDGSLDINSGTIQDNKRSEYSGAGGALYLNRVKTKISGGTFKGNLGSDEGGGAIKIINSDLHITGGNFIENECLAWGGAINVRGGTVKIDGGSFTGNTASASGGALSLSGGTERYNGAQGVINAGYFANNTAKGFYGGGAIYNDNNSKLTINNSLIRNNTVKEAFIIGAGNHLPSQQGGGVWNCPYGTTVMNITQGVAIFDNKAGNAGTEGQYKGAGDDFLSVSKHDYGEKTPTAGQPVKLSERMLGGGARVWYQDGSTYDIRLNWDKANQLPRYVEGGKNQRIVYNKEINDNKAFKSVPSKDSKALAEKLARVVIENNVATRAGFTGGGIGNNGLLTFGSPEKWKLQVKKAWEGDDPEQRPSKITLDVLVGGYQVDQVELSKENNWTAAVENFPDPDTLIDAQTGKKLPITFREHDENGKQLDGYQLAVTGESKDEGTKTYNISVVNKMPTKVEVVKKWANPDGTCPDASQIEVQLLANGKATDKKLTLNAANSWKGKFEDLPKYVDGKLAKYTVSEVEIKGYRSEVSGDATKGFTVTNTCTVPPPGDTPPPPKKTPPLPRTGSGISAALALGILAVASGVVLVRRRMQNA